VKSILLVPSVRRGNGSGHLVRCFSLAKALGRGAAVFLSENPRADERGSAELQLAYHNDFEAIRVITALRDERWDLIVLDRFTSTYDEYLFWSTYGPVAAIDEGGGARAYAEYLIDALPHLPSGTAGWDGANVSSLGFLALPEARRTAPGRISSVLVSFGGEDPAGLTEAFLAAAVDSGRLSPGSVTVVCGALAQQSGARRDGITYLGPIQDLREKLSSYDLVVTQFGLTAFEAAWAGCAVLLLNPSALHQRLSAAAGFVSLGVRKPSFARLDAALGDARALAQASAAAAPPERLDLAVRLASLEPRHAGACPACGGRTLRAVYRDQDRSYRRCADCGLVSMAYFGPRRNPYDNSAYFFEDYKKQYGRTYLEDLPSIRALAARRLDVMERYLPAGRDGAVVLDVGCAYGAFLMEAHARGWHPVGTDLSTDAVAYVRDTLRLPAFVSDFSGEQATGLYPDTLDALTLWYVIEHFDDLGRVLARAQGLLRPGGVLALSTPSAAGVSARLRPESFWSSSPADHFTVWDPRTTAGLLRRWGFKMVAVRITGHHPERFPGVPNKPRSLRYRLAMAASRLFGLGDTFECYALRVDDGHKDGT